MRETFREQFKSVAFFSFLLCPQNITENGDSLQKINSSGQKSKKIFLTKLIF